MFPQISIIIPFIEDNSWVKEIIDSCVHLDYPKHLYEVILVYNGSGVLPDYLVQPSDDVSITLIKEGMKGPYAARNAGAKIAQGDILLFTDVDCIIDQKWVQRMILPFNDKQVCAVIGSVRAYCPTTTLEYFGDQYIFNHTTRMFTYFIAGNGAIRRTVFADIGGFNATFTSGGDVDLSMRMLQKGMSVYYEPEAVVFHRHRKTLKNLFKQYKKYGAGWARLKTCWGKALPMYSNFKRIFIVIVFMIFSLFESIVYMFGPHTAIRKATLLRHFYLGVMHAAFIFGFYFSKN